MNFQASLFVLLACFQNVIGASHGSQSLQGHQTYTNYVQHGHHTNCLLLSSFSKLHHLGETDGCLSANSVWHYLDDLQVKSPECRQQIQTYMAEKYAHATSQNGDNCACRQRRPLVDHEIHRMNNGSYSTCLREKGTYHQITTDLFSNIRTKGCQNHNYLWTKLQGITNHCTTHHLSLCTHYVDCTEDLLVRAAIQYPHDSSDSCVCSEVPTTTLPLPTTQTAKATSPSTTSPTSSIVRTTQTTVPEKQYTCNKIAVVENIAMSVHMIHPNSSPCVSGDGGFDDAYVLSACNTTSPNTWRAGANVMADCKSRTHLIPPFTPISTFSHGVYFSLGAQSGIFLECINNNIKIAVQKCNGVPEIILIDTGVLVDNQENFYVIV